jgi:hypothetical protein
MAKDPDNSAENFETENTGGLLSGFLAEEDEFDRRALWRLGSWAVASVGAVIVAVLANQSSIGLRREQVAVVELAQQSQQIQSLAKQSQGEARRLASAIDTLNGDRDRLYTRVTVLEQGLDSVTGSIAKQVAKPEVLKPEVLKPEVLKPEVSKPEVSKADVSKLDVSKADNAKVDASKSGTAKAETTKPEIAKSETSKSEIAKSETSKPEIAKADRPDSAKSDNVKPASPQAATAGVPAASAAADLPAIPPIASAAPVVAPVTTTAAATVERPPAPATVASISQAPNAPASPSTPIPAPAAASPAPPNPVSPMEWKSITAPPDPAASKLIEANTLPNTSPNTRPDTRPKTVISAPIPEVVASAPPAAEAQADDTRTKPAEVAVQRTEFGIDVGGANSVGGLRALWRGLLKSRSNAALTVLHPIIVVKENTGGSGMQLRLVAGPLADAAAAAKICAAMAENKRPCETTVFDGQRLAMNASEQPAPAARPAPARRHFAPRHVVANDEPKKPEPSTFDRIFHRN